MEKRDIKSLLPGELREEMAALGQSPFRAEQVFAWLHGKRVYSFAEMTNLSKELRTTLDKNFYINSIKIVKRLVSAVDGTVKYLYELRDGNCIEAVLMHYNHGYSLCISTQAGCRMGCRFCASTIGGLSRDLTAGEMLDEIYTAMADSGQPVSSIVLMGIGEPLDNFDAVVRFLELLSCPGGLGLSLRHVSLSTCGLADAIDRLRELKLGLTLSVSLHAPDDKLRSSMMPINDRYNIERLMRSCRAYFKCTGRRISFEYALIENVNDSPETARRLAKLLEGMPAHVNLIPVNTVQERKYRRSKREAVYRFQKELAAAGVNATVRRELGGDIQAACGQLRRERNNKGER